MRITLMVAAAALLIAAAQGPRTRLGVVDLEVVFEAHPGKPAMQEELLQLRDTLQNKITELEAKAADLTNKMELYKKGSPNRDTIEKDLTLVGRELEYERNFAATSFQKQKLASREKIVVEVNKIIREFGAKNGYTAILQQRMNIANDIPTWDSVLYHPAHVDVTNRIIDQMKKAAPPENGK